MVSGRSLSLPPAYAVDSLFLVTMISNVVVFAVRFCTTGLPSDVVIEVGDMTFHLHKVGR